MSSKTPLRNKPQQSRSQQRVDLVLDTAAELFVEVGYASATTNAIAERAGISIGSLYRYFPDKEAVLYALADRYFTEMRELYERIFTPDAIYLPLPILVDRVLDPFIDFYGSCPTIKHLLLAADVSEDIADAMRDFETMTTDRIKSLFLAANIEDEQAYLVAIVSKALVKSMMALLTPDLDADIQNKITTEFKRLFVGYLAPVFNKGE